jgi:hypothetical protein
MVFDVSKPMAFDYSNPADSGTDLAHRNRFSKICMQFFLPEWILKLSILEIILLPFGLLKVLANIGKWLRLSPVGAKTLNFISNPVIIDSSEFFRRFNFTPKYDTKQTMIQFSSTR